MAFSLLALTSEVVGTNPVFLRTGRNTALAQGPQTQVLRLVCYQYRAAASAVKSQTLLIC